VINSNTAASSTRSALTGANVGISASMVDYPLALLGIARLVLLVLAAVTAAGAAFLTALKACRGSRRRGSLGSAADGAMSGLVWLTMLAAVALFALYTTWLLSALAADMLLNTATQCVAEARGRGAGCSSWALVCRCSVCCRSRMRAAGPSSLLSPPPPSPPHTHKHHQVLQHRRARAQPCRGLGQLAG
jgi:hypothetical protein